jgi:hypothetical protein
MRPRRLPLVTSARFCGEERASSKGLRGDGQPVERSKPRAGQGGHQWMISFKSDFVLILEAG